MFTVDRRLSVVRALNGQAQEVWIGRMGADPPEFIRYQDGHMNMAIPVDRSSDADIIHAIEQRQNSK